MPISQLCRHALLSASLAVRAAFSTSLPLSGRPGLLPLPSLPLVNREVGYPVADGKGAQPGQVLKWEQMVDAFGSLQSGANIFVHGIAATPTPLLGALSTYVKESDLSRITLHHMHLEGPTPWLDDAEVRSRLRSNSLFTGHNLRHAVNDGSVDFNSIFLHELPLLFSTGAIKLDMALVQVSPPDAKGFCSLGTSVDFTRAACKHAKVIVAMCNANMPRTLGDSLIHRSHVDLMIEGGELHHPIHKLNFPEVGEAERRIGELIAANLVDDGATLQMGIGAIPDAALTALADHRDLGIHTEMFSDGLLPLIESNAVTNAKKKLYPGRSVVSFVYGSQKLYDFLHDNVSVHFGDVGWVNDPEVIAKNPKVTAINSAVEVDLTGQVVSDSIGHRFLSGFGGQVDFIYGASKSSDGLGKPIIALPSITKKGESKIVPYIQQGSGVVTSRAHVRYVVTEQGIAQLWGKNMRQRAYELIKIAHPNNQAALEKAAFDRLKVMPSSE